VAGDGGDTRLITGEFLILGVATMLFFASMGAANPVLPRFVDGERGAGEAAVGLVLGGGALASLLIRPWFGRLGDLRGPRILMVVGPVIGLVGYAGFILVDSVPSALVVRLPAGAAIAAVMTGATTLALEITPEERKGEAASYILVAFHFGLGLGPLLGEAVLEAWSYNGVWLVLSAMCLASTAVALILPSRPLESDMTPGSLLHPRGVVPGIVIALAMMAFIGFNVFAPLYAEEIDVQRVGPVFLVSSLSIAVVRIVAGKVPDRVGPIVASTIALAAISCGCVVLAFWQSVGGLYVGAAILAGGGALVMPSMVPAAVEGVPVNRRSSAMATFSMFIDVASAMTGPLFGLVISGGGYRAAYLSALGTTLLAWVVLQFVLAPQWYARRHAEAVELGRQSP
jgi:MFS family permease